MAAARLELSHVDPDELRAMEALAPIGPAPCDPARDVAVWHHGQQLSQLTAPRRRVNLAQRRVPRLTEPERMPIGIAELERVHTNPIDAIDLARVAAPRGDGVAQRTDVVRLEEDRVPAAIAISVDESHARRPERHLGAAISNFETKHVSIKRDTARRLGDGQLAEHRRDHCSHRGPPMSFRAHPSLTVLIMKSRRKCPAASGASRAADGAAGGD